MVPDLQCHVIRYRSNWSIKGEVSGGTNEPVKCLKSTSFLKSFALIIRGDNTFICNIKTILTFWVNTKIVLLCLHSDPLLATKLYPKRLKWEEIFNEYVYTEMYFVQTFQQSQLTTCKLEPTDKEDLLDIDLKHTTSEYQTTAPSTEIGRQLVTGYLRVKYTLTLLLLSDFSCEGRWCWRLVGLHCWQSCPEPSVHRFLGRSASFDN